MFALVHLSDHSLVDVPHEPYAPQAIEGQEWWPIQAERPSFNRKTDVCTAGDLYADPQTKRVRRHWIVREKTPYELAEERGLHHLKMLAFSDQQMVRALEDFARLLVSKGVVTWGELPEITQKKFRDRENWRGLIK